MSREISSKTLLDLSAALKAQELSPVDIVRAGLDQAEANAELNAFVVRAEPEVVLEEARASEARWAKRAPLGPLDGITITVKDAIVTREWPTLMGSRAIDPSAMPREDAPAVARMREQGAIILGKTTTPELGWKAVCDSPLTGITRNPWNRAMTPGGSSGGSAAALAAGIGHAAIGTDAGGSVRIPGSFCGLVALKATRGRIAAYPPSALWTLGHIGPMCRTVSDTALMLAFMSQPDARDWNGAPPDPALKSGRIEKCSMKGVRIAYSPTYGYARVQSEIATSVEGAAKRFTELGAEVELVEAPFEDPTPVFRTLFAAGIAHSVRRWSHSQLDLLDPGLQDMVEFGERIDRRAFMEATDASIALSRHMRLFHQRYDFLLSPTVAVAPFRAGLLSPEGYNPDDWFDWSPFTYPFNMTGQPAITIPCGITHARLPIGLQLVGAPYSEAKLLAVSLAFEQATPSIGTAIG